MKKIFLLLIVAVAFCAMASDDVTLHKPLQLGPKNRNQIIMQGLEIADSFVLDQIKFASHLKTDTGGTVYGDTSNAVFTCEDVFTCIDTDNVIATQSYVNNNSWLKTGNAGTNPATNFIGTTDDVDLVFKRNNRAYGYFGGTNLALGDSAGFYHGLLGGDYNIFLGYGAGKHDAPSGAIGNIAIGYRTLEVNPASYNIAIGYEALEANTTNGAANIAIGLTAGKLNTSGELNTFVGNSSGSINTTGGHNSFFGDNSGVTNTTGSYNSFFGDGASGLYDTTSYSTAIGVEALSAFKSVAVGYKSRALVPNTIILGDTNTLTGVGIGTVYPSAKLDVRGTIRIVDGTQGLGKVLTSDADGLASWQSKYGTPTKDSISATGGNISLSLYSTHVIICTSTVTAVTLNFPSGNTGDWLLVLFNASFGSASITNTGTGSGTITTTQPSARCISKTYINIGGNWY